MSSPRPPKSNEAPATLVNDDAIVQSTAEDVAKPVAPVATTQPAVTDTVKAATPVATTQSAAAEPVKATTPVANAQPTLHITISGSEALQTPAVEVAVKPKTPVEAAVSSSVPTVAVTTPSAPNIADVKAELPSNNLYEKLQTTVIDEIKKTNELLASTKSLISKLTPKEGTFADDAIFIAESAAILSFVKKLQQAASTLSVLHEDDVLVRISKATHIQLDTARHENRKVKDRLTDITLTKIKNNQNLENAFEHFIDYAVLTAKISNLESRQAGISLLNQYAMEQMQNELVKTTKEVEQAKAEAMTVRAELAKTESARAEAVKALAQVQPAKVAPPAAARRNQQTGCAKGFLSMFTCARTEVEQPAQGQQPERRAQIR